MADFTINSLATGTLSNTDAIVKSNADGVLTKVTGEQLKKDILGVTDVSALGNGIYEMLYNTTRVGRYTSLNIPKFSRAASITRFGNRVMIEISNISVKEAVVSGEQIATLPAGYKGTSLYIRDYCLAVTPAGGIYRCEFRVANDGLFLTPYGRSGVTQIQPNDVIWGIINYFTEDAPV